MQVWMRRSIQGLSWLSIFVALAVGALYYWLSWLACFDSCPTRQQLTDVPVISSWQQFVPFAPYMVCVVGATLLLAVALLQRSRYAFAALLLALLVALPFVQYGVLVLYRQLTIPLIPINAVSLPTDQNPVLDEEALYTWVHLQAAFVTAVLLVWPIVLLTIVRRLSPLQDRTDALPAAPDTPSGDVASSGQV